MKTLTLILRSVRCFKKNLVKHLYLLSFSLVVLLFISACKFQVDEGIQWDTDLLVPLAYSTVGIEDIIQDSSLLAVNNDNSLSVIYRDTIASLVLRDLVAIPDTTQRIIVTLDSLSLSPDSIVQKITLGYLARQLVASGDANGQLILGAHGTTLFAVPAITGLSSGLIDIDASDFFEFADLSEGKLDLRIRNQLPLNLANVYLRVGNKVLGNDILRDTFPLIPSRDSVLETYNLANQRVENTLEGEMSNLDIQSGLGVPVDTNDFVEIVLRARDLKAYEATAIFPQQTIIDTVRSNSYRFPSEYADVQLSLLKIKSGRIKAKMISTIQDSILFSYQLLSAQKDGQTPGVVVKINPAPPGGSTTQEASFALDGFVVDMTRNGTPGVFNSFFEELRVDLLYSGNLVNITLSDSIVIEFGLVDIEVDYVEGYFGRDEFRFTGRERLEIFNDLNVRKIRFSRPTASIRFSNSIGMDGQVVIREMKGINPASGNSVRLSGAPMLAGPVRIGGATQPDIHTAVITDLGFTPQNSNITSFINLLPGEVEYDIQVSTNQNGVPGRFDNFATENSQINALIDIDIPLDGVLDELVMRDTTEIDFGNASVNDINSLLLRLIVDNRYPFEAVLQANMLDAEYRVIDVLAERYVISPGIVDDYGYVQTGTSSTLEKSFSQGKLIELINDAKYIAFQYTLSTRPAGQAVKIYHDYQIKARMVGQFNYSIK